MLFVEYIALLALELYQHVFRFTSQYRTVALSNPQLTYVGLTEHTPVILVRTMCACVQ
jgi:hypothetical protein